MSEKIHCKDANVTSEALEAQAWANDMVRRECRGPGDMENAMRRLEYRYGIPWRTFWSLRYRRPDDVLTGLYKRLNAAYHAEVERQTRLLQHDAEITKILHPDAPAVASAEALVAEMAKED